MKEYQRKKNNKYILPTPLYNQIIWQIRDYYRLKEQYNSIPTEGKSVSDIDGMPHGKVSGDDGMVNMVEKMQRLSTIIKIIDKERDSIPEEYRQGVWNNIMYRMAYPDDADRTTYARWKSRMIYNVAKNEGLIKE